MNIKESTKLIKSGSLLPLKFKLMATKRGIEAENEFECVIKLNDRRQKRKMSWRYFDL